MRGLLAIALVCIGCGGDSGGGPVPIDQLGQRLTQALCQHQVKCGVVSSQAACEELFGRTLAAAENDLAAGVRDGTIKYDATRAGECVSAFDAESCDPTQENRRVPPAVCQDAIQGTVADGGPCATNNQCISRSCATTACTMACCPGTCDPTPAAPPAIGQPCTGTCVDGAFCSNPTNGTCMALLAPGATCTTDGQCGYGTACLGATGARTCGAVPRLGDPCVQHGGTTATACITEGLVCDATTHCVAHLDSGAACATNTQPTCKADLSCDPTAMTCGAPPAIGQACTTLCAAGAFCDTMTLKCTAWLADGQMCTGSSQCQSGHCDTTTKQCTTPATCA